MKQTPTSLFFSIILYYIVTHHLEQPIQAAKTKTKTKNPKDKKKARYANICGKNHPELNNRGYKILDTIRTFTRDEYLEFYSSPQHRAMCWLIHQDQESKGTSTTGSKLKDRYALATLWFATKPDVWNVSTNWLSKESVCNWYGITCDNWKNVVDIDLGFNGLLGLVPSEIALLDNLEGLRLTANDIQGVIPTSIGHLSNLKVIQFNMNGFFGLIPTTIGKLENLRELHLYGNYLDGKIPTELGNLKNLEILDLYANFFKGSLPKEISNLKKLKGMYLNDNEMEGSIPSEICASNTALEYFVSDCRGHSPKIKCKCCTHCCMDKAEPKCKKMETKKS